MLMPSIFGENLLDDFFGEPFGGYDYSESGLMTTDVKDTDKGYEVTMNMPGVKKEDVKAELKDGMLKTDTILRPQEVFNMDDSVLVFEQTPVTEVVKIIQEKTGIQIDLAKGLEKNQITTRINIDEPDIAGELAFLCGCKCETLVKGKH